MDRHTSKFERMPRAARACFSCHARKVRCDISVSKPRCSNCEIDGRRCEPRPRQRRANPAAKVSSEHLTGADSLLRTQTPVKPSRNSNPPTRANALHSGAFIQDSWNTGVTEASNRPQQITGPSPASEASSLPSTYKDGYMERSYLGPDSFRAEDGAEVNYELQGSSETSKKILDLQKAFELPPRAIRNSLLENFWTYCHPWDPVVERSQILSTPPEKMSPFLLQAIFLAASRVSSGSASYAGPAEFYKRAKTLFWLDHEQDPLTNLTAVALLHWWNPHGPERVSTNTSTFWLRIAISLAQQMGLHNQRRPVENESLRRRIWWSLVVQTRLFELIRRANCETQARDCLVSMAHGRPQAINLEFCDVPRPKVEDFPDSPFTGMIFTAYVDISLILGRFTSIALRRLPSRVHVTDIEDSLYRWVKTLPESIRMTRQNKQGNTERIVPPYNLQSRQLHVLYLVAIILLYRPRTLEGPFPILAVTAASTMVGIFEDFLARDEIRFLSTTYTFYLLAASIALLSCYRYVNLWGVAQEDLQIIRRAQEELKKRWPSALGSMNSFERMYKVAVSTQKRVDGLPQTGLSQGQGVLFEDLDMTLCRLWSVLHRQNTTENTAGNVTSQQVSVRAEPISGGDVSLSQTIVPVQGEAPAQVVDFNQIFQYEASQLNGSFGDWLFWDNLALGDNSQSAI